MPATITSTIAPNGNRGGKRMWPSLETASRIADVANFLFIASLVVGVVSTILIAWTAHVKETHWDIDRRASRERIAQLDNETARVRANETRIIDSLLTSAQAASASLRANQADRTVMELTLLALGLAQPENISEAAKSLYIIQKVSPFAGKQFDAVATSSALELETLLLSLRHALKAAGWIEVDRSDGGTAHRSSVGGPALVRIDVDASKDSALLDAAETLASALNAAAIAATVNPMTDTATAKANVIHILVGPKL